jgi:hypothetical protein
MTKNKYFSKNKKNIVVVFMNMWKYMKNMLWWIRGEKSSFPKELLVWQIQKDQKFKRSGHPRWNLLRWNPIAGLWDCAQTHPIQSQVWSDDCNLDCRILIDLSRCGLQATRQLKLLSLVISVRKKVHRP